MQPGGAVLIIFIRGRLALQPGSSRSLLSADCLFAAGGEFYLPVCAAPYFSPNHSRRIYICRLAREQRSFCESVRPYPPLQSPVLSIEAHVPSSFRGVISLAGCSLLPGDGGRGSIFRQAGGVIWLDFA